MKGEYQEFIMKLLSLLLNVPSTHSREKSSLIFLAHQESNVLRKEAITVRSKDPNT
jgi:hypothetical protein